MITAKHLIQPPARTSYRGTVIITVVVLLLSVATFAVSLRPWLALAAFVSFIAALFVKEVQALVFALLALLILAVPHLHPLLFKWPWRLLIPVALFLAVTLPIARLRSQYGWFKPGRISREVALLTIGIAVVSAAALFLWVRMLSPDLSRHLAHIPAVSAWLLPLAGLAFSAGNAAVEEFVFRGVYMHSLDSAFGAGAVSILAQGWLFGAIHYLSGFPNGLAGLVLATAYGVMLGALRRRSRGILAPWLAHAGADMIIFVILLTKMPG